MIRAADVLAEARRVPDFAGASTVTPDWTPVHARIRDEATDRLGRPGRRRPARRRRASRSSAARPADRSARRSRSTARRTPPRTGVVLNTGTDAVGAADRRARGHAVLDQPRRAAAAELPGVADRARRRRDRRRAGARRSPASASRVTVLEAADRILGARGAGGQRAGRRRSSRAEGIQVLAGRDDRVGVRTPTGSSPSRSDGTDAAAPTSCSSPPAAGPTSPTSGSTPSGSTRRRGRSRSTTRMRARRRRALGDRRHHRQGRLHAHVDVPGGDRGARHPRPGRPGGGVPRGAARDLHRPRGRLGRDDREAGARRRAQRARRHDGPRLVDPRLDRQGHAG